MHIETQFSVFLFNKPGVLAAVTDALAKARVNLRALAMMDAGDHGALRFLCDQPDEARVVLGKTHDRWSECDVLALELDHRPGAFSAVAKLLADAHVNIDYAYCSGGAGGGKVTAVFKVADLAKAQKLLAGAGQRTREKAVPQRQGTPGRRRK